MTNYLFFVSGLNKEIWFCGETEKDARQKLWNALPDEAKDRVASIECIDQE